MLQCLVEKIFIDADNIDMLIYEDKRKVVVIKMVPI